MSRIDPPKGNRPGLVVTQDRGGFLCLGVPFGFLGRLLLHDGVENGVVLGSGGEDFAQSSGGNSEPVRDLGAR
jgi:hypothetical protein